jgi:hypothetical protein
MGDSWEEALPSRPPRGPDLPSEMLEAGNRLVVQVPVALEYWMDEGQRAYVLEALHQRLNSETACVASVWTALTETGVVLDPIHWNKQPGSGHHHPSHPYADARPWLRVRSGILGMSIRPTD